MNSKQIAVWTAGLGAGVFFIWLALRGLNLAHIGQYLQAMKLGWIFPFAVVAFLGNFFRALRWRLLFHDPERVGILKITTAVLVGYSANVAVPRLGEISRCGYLVKGTKINLGEALATVVIERVFDVFSLLLLLLATLLFVVSDSASIEHLLGVKASTVYQLLGYLVVIIAIGILALILLHRNRERFDNVVATIEAKLPFLKKIIQLMHQVLDGMIAIKKLRQWPLFILYTVLIWSCYVGMSWVPFQSIEDPTLNELTFFDGFDVMVISSIGVVIPSPSGIGTYHFFTQKVLTLLHNVSAEPAMAYAIVAHAVMILSILFSTVLAVFADWLNIKKSISRN